MKNVQYKELLQPNQKKDTNDPIKNGQRTSTDISPKMTHKWPIDTRKDV